VVGDEIVTPADPDASPAGAALEDAGALVAGEEDDGAGVVDAGFGLSRSMSK
jgi:hypothetical protein